MSEQGMSISIDHFSSSKAATSGKSLASSSAADMSFSDKFSRAVGVAHGDRQDSHRAREDAQSMATTQQGTASTKRDAAQHTMPEKTDSRRAAHVSSEKVSASDKGAERGHGNATDDVLDSDAPLDSANRLSGSASENLKKVHRQTTEPADSASDNLKKVHGQMAEFADDVGDHLKNLHSQTVKFAESTRGDSENPYGQIVEPTDSAGVELKDLHEQIAELVAGASSTAKKLDGSMAESADSASDGLKSGQGQVLETSDSAIFDNNDAASTDLSDTSDIIQQADLSNAGKSGDTINSPIADSVISASETTAELVHATSSTAVGGDGVPIDDNALATTDETLFKAAVVTHAVAEKTVSVALQAKVDGTDSSTATSRSLNPGEHLTPAALANRQAHLAGVSPVTVDASDQPVAESVQLEQSGAVRATTLARGEMLDVKGAAQVTTTIASDATASATVEGDKAARQQLEQQDAEAATAIAEEQLSDEMSVEKKQQQIHQLTQNSRVATVIAASTSAPVSSDDSSRPGASAIDNLFHTSTGGTVTAPLPNRTDAGNPQTIYAPINTPILQNDADKAMAGNIRWMSNEGIKNATINLTPNGMGPITVSIGMDKEHMNVAIVAPHGSTREALEAMLPRLREQLSLQGHTSINVDISDGGTENSGREFADQFANGQTGSEHNLQARNRSVEREETSTSFSNGVTAPGHVQEATIAIMNGQTIPRYDVYV